MQYDPLVTRFDGQTFRGVVMVRDKPYAVFLDRRADTGVPGSPVMSHVHLVPFVDADVTLGPDEPLHDGNNGLNHRGRK